MSGPRVQLVAVQASPFASLRLQSWQTSRMTTYLAASPKLHRQAKRWSHVLGARAASSITSRRPRHFNQMYSSGLERVEKCRARQTPFSCPSGFSPHLAEWSMAFITPPQTQPRYVSFDYQSDLMTVETLFITWRMHGIYQKHLLFDRRIEPTTSSVPRISPSRWNSRCMCLRPGLYLL